MDYNELFQKFTRPNYFSRVDNSHPLDLFLGLDERGRKTFELRSIFSPRKVTGTSAIEVNQYNNRQYQTIRFSLCDEEISGLFYKFCKDLTEFTRDTTEKENGYKLIVSRFFQWKKMFVSAKVSLLSESEIMGLIGEILFLKNVLATRIGLINALKSWSGQELTHKDFSYNDTWSEVKTISRGVTGVKISSLEQLDSPNEGELVVYSLEKMGAAYNGITLNKLVLETRNQFTPGEDRDSFLAKVALQGYEYNDYYDNYVYEVSNYTCYRVNESFPRLTHKSVPAPVIKAAYELALTELTPFRID